MTRPRSLGELAAHVGGRVHGDSGLLIRSASTLEQAGAGDITFLANPKYRNLVRKTRAAAVVVGEDLGSPAALLIVDDPYYAFARIVTMMYGHRQHRKTGISARSSVAETAVLGEDTHVHDFATVSEGARIGSRCVLYPGVFIGEQAQIGDDCLLYPNVVVYEGCKIGNRVIIQANATVGDDGFGYATHGGEHHKIPHIGRVLIEDDVELGAGCAIERGAFDDTIVGEGTKIGDSVVIGHGATIGAHGLLVAQVGVAGSTAIGHHCVAGGQVGISGHLKIGDEVSIGAQSGVGSDIPDRAAIFGSPAFEARRAKRAYLEMRRLPDLPKRLRELERRLADIEEGEKST